MVNWNPKPALKAVFWPWRAWAADLRSALWVLLLGLAALAPGVASAAADGARTLDITVLPGNSLALTDWVDVLVDPDGRLSLDEVSSKAYNERFAPRPQRGDAQGFSYTRDTVWLRLVVRNTSVQEVDRVLHIAYALLAEVDFFQVAPDGTRRIVQVGYTRPQAAQPYRSRFIVLPFAVPPKSEQTLYLRVASPNSMNIPARLWEAPAFFEYENRSYGLQGLYFGMMIGLAVYNLMLFFALRDTSYLLYVLFGVSVGLAMAGFTGLGFEYLWPDNAFLQMAGINMAGTVGALAILLFARRVLSTARLVPRFDQAISVLLVVNALCLVALPFAFRQMAPVFVVLNMTTSLFLLVTGLVCAFKRERSALYFVVAFGVILVAIALGHLRNLGLLPTTTLTSDGTQIGSALEMILLSFALADRYNVLRRRSAEALDQAMRAQGELVRTLQASEQTLEARVQERTAELQDLNRRLEAISATDGLTGIANRRHFDVTLASEWARARRTGAPLALGLVDVDRFKAYNDHYGHQAGDDVLRRVAQSLRESFPRRGDLVARYGGEEFVFLVPGTDSAQAQRLAERAREAVERLGLVHTASELAQITVSVGVAACVVDAGTTPQTLIEAADRALYRAKSGGRNRVVLAEPFIAPDTETPNA